MHTILHDFRQKRDRAPRTADFEALRVKLLVSIPKRLMSHIPVPSRYLHPADQSPSPSPPPPPGNMSRPTRNNVPRPMSTYTDVSSHSPSSHLSETRQRQSRRDEAIRKKIETELSRKRPGGAKRHTSQKSKRQAGTVSALRPLPALTVPDSITVADASQLCAAKRTDCVLVVDEDEHLCGIFTAKDLAFRVIGDGLDPRVTTVSQIMTRNPMVTRDTTSATEALTTMVTRGFRHLPVCNEEGDVVGLLDITKVFHESLEKLERAYGSSQKLYNAIEGVQSEFGGAGGGGGGAGGSVASSNPLMAYVEALRNKMSFPDLGSILDARTSAATVGVKTSVRDAARLMREHHTTAVCVMENDGRKIAGIFTSKDVVLRVIAAGLDAKTCSVVRVMTPHPDTASPQMSIQDALRKMHDGHYLNLPVVDEDGTLQGCVDVLKLTYATLEQVNSISADGQTDESGNPVWSRFFASFGQAGSVQDDDATSALSGSGLPQSHGGGGNGHPSTPSHRLRHHVSANETPGSELAPNDSASVVHDEPESTLATSVMMKDSVAVAAAVEVDDGTYLFKFVAPGGTAHRFQARYDTYEFIREIVEGKLSSDPFFTEPVGGDDQTTTVADPGDFQLSYFDDDNDLVLITHDRDVVDSVSLARKQGKDRVVLHLRGGKGWTEESMKRGDLDKGAAARAVEVITETEERGVEKSKTKKGKSHGNDDDDLIGGFLPKDLVLPAAISFLGITILGVFIATRSSR